MSDSRKRLSKSDSRAHAQYMVDHGMRTQCPAGEGLDIDRLWHDTRLPTQRLACDPYGIRGLAVLNRPAPDLGWSGACSK